MHAILALEEAVGVLALDEDIGGLDAGGVAILIVHDLVGKAVALCPARVHAVQHRAPVLRLGAACAGMEGHEGVVAVVFTGEQRAELLLCYGLLELLEAGLKLLEHGLVVLLDRHLADGQQVVAQRAHPAIRLDLALQKPGWEDLISSSSTSRFACSMPSALSRPSISGLRLFSFTLYSSNCSI